MISTLFYDVAVPAIALLVLIAIFRGLWWLFIGRFERKATHAAPHHATFHHAAPRPLPSHTALSLAFDLSGRGRGKAATPSAATAVTAAAVPAPAGQPHLPGPGVHALSGEQVRRAGEFQRCIDQAWLTAGVNARTRCWVPDMRDTATAWDRRNAADLRAILDRADTNKPYVDRRFDPIGAQARLAIEGAS